MTMSTPVRVSRLNLSSLLTDLTPNTHTWSRLKAALSVHRKGVGRLTHTQTHAQQCRILFCFKLFLTPAHSSSIVLHTPKNSALVFTPRRAELVDVSQDLFASPFRSSLPRRLQSQLVGRNPVCFPPAGGQTWLSPSSAPIPKKLAKVTTNTFILFVFSLASEHRIAKRNKHLLTYEIK